MNDIQKLLAEAMRTPGTTIITKATFRPAIEVQQGLVAQSYQHSWPGDAQRLPEKPSLLRYIKDLTKCIINTILYCYGGAR